jgi:hypothetical protein
VPHDPNIVEGFGDDEKAHPKRPLDDSARIGLRIVLSRSSPARANSSLFALGSRAISLGSLLHPAYRGVIVRRGS